MRTKALILSAAFGAVGIATSMAQVYSVNGVGYYTLDLPGGFSMIANQLNNGDNSLNAILPTAPLDATIAKWDSVNQTFLPSDTYFGPDFGGWVDGNLDPSTTVLNPGEGAFINLPNPAALTFVGEIPQGDLSVSIAPGFSIISQGTPQAAGIQATGLPATLDDTVLFWNNGINGYDSSLTYFGPDFGGWVDGDLNAVDPTPAVGESFFYNSAAGSTVSWNRSFSIND
jgi:hypothetical protein